MKKLILLFAVILASFSSCKKDNNVTPEPEPSIVGKWYISQWDPVGTGLNDYMHICATNKDYHTFYADGTAIQIVHNSSCTVSSSIEFGYTVSGNTLTLTLSGSSMPYQILELNQTKLDTQGLQRVVFTRAN